MPFGKKVLTPKAHTKGVGDEQHIQGALDFLVRSRLMSLPEDDSPATREQRQAGFVEAEEFFKRLEWMQPCNSQVFRSRFALLLPACVRAYPRTRTTANQAADGATPVRGPGWSHAFVFTCSSLRRKLSRACWTWRAVSRLGGCLLGCETGGESQAVVIQTISCQEVQPPTECWAKFLSWISCETTWRWMSVASRRC